MMRATRPAIMSPTLGLSRVQRGGQGADALGGGDLAQQRRADALQHHEAHHALAGFLVARHRLQGGFAAVGVERNRRLDLQPLDQLERALAVGHRVAQLQRAAQPEGDGLTVREMAVLGGSFESVADGVPEVEERPRAALALVAGDDARLETDRAFDERNERLGVSGGGLFQIALAQVEQVAALEERTFDYLGEAAPALA